jgi:uncharacterized protein (DUF58 family)
MADVIVLLLFMSSDFWSQPIPPGVRAFNTIENGNAKVRPESDVTMSLRVARTVFTLALAG